MNSFVRSVERERVLEEMARGGAREGKQQCVRGDAVFPRMENAAALIAPSNRTERFCPKHKEFSFRRDGEPRVSNATKQSGWKQARKKDSQG